MDPVLIQVLWTTFTFSCCGSLAAAGLQFWNRKQEGPGLDQAAAVGALIGAAFGALVGIFQSMLSRL